MTIFFNKTAGMVIILAMISIAISGCQSEKQISFAQDVQPIIDQHCIECHAAGGQGVEVSGFNMETYEGVMKGTRNGPMIIAGDSAGSNMLVLMQGRADPSISMPHGKMKGATGKQLKTIQTWIDQGAKNN
jgi:uncharacterized membrane protein